MTDPLAVARSALGGERAWLVGGAVRDRLLDRETLDLDIVAEGDVEAAARAITLGCRRGGAIATCFILSREFHVWRVVAGSWQIDVQPLQGDSLEDDLRMRDFTVNAIAQPLHGGDLIDPLGGVEDLAERRLRATGEHVFDVDPLRILRLARIAVQQELDPVTETVVMAQRCARTLDRVSGERVFSELRKIVASPRARQGLELIDQLGATEVVLPELAALRGVKQSRYHHLDVYRHTIEVLEGVIALQRDPEAILLRGRSDIGSADAVVDGEEAMTRKATVDREETEGERWAIPRAGRREDLVTGVATVLSEGLADGMTRGEGLRWGALLHDVAKPATRAVSEDGRVTFIGHDLAGAQLAEAVLRRLRSSTRLQVHIGSLAAHHLHLGFLVHRPQPLDRGTVYDYLHVCDPVTVDVTLLSIADRLATRGDRAEEAIAAHIELARDLLGEALRWHRDGPPQPLVGGDELVRTLGISAGPEIGRLLGELTRATYVGEVHTREDALTYASRVI